MLFFSTLLFADDSLPVHQKIVCNVGYTAERCHREATLVRAMLTRYHADWLGDWTWVLVRTDDWKPVVKSVRLNPESPAFSDLSRRETFFDEALFAPNAHRRAELLEVWQMPLDRLATLAITHEIGHAMCADRNEVNANNRARLLMAGKLPGCGNELKRAGR
jgi:hypothetical protein